MVEIQSTARMREETMRHRPTTDTCALSNGYVRALEETPTTTTQKRKTGNQFTSISFANNC